MSTTTTNPKIKIIGVLMIIASALMIVAGVVTWVLVSSQLKAEHIEVAAITPKNPGSLAGKPVAGPFTAYAQANAINEHTLEGSGGRTYAQIGDDATALKAKLAKDGLSKEEVAKNPDVIALNTTRDTSVKGSFLRASLFTSVVAFGVAALVIGLGVLFALIGFALMKLSTETVTSSPPIKSSEPSGAKA
jgi:ABC-type sugar transport system permease subunit